MKAHRRRGEANRWGSGNQGREQTVVGARELATERWWVTSSGEAAPDLEVTISFPDEEVDRATDRAAALGISVSEDFARAVDRYLAAGSLTEQENAALDRISKIDGFSVTPSTPAGHISPSALTSGEGVAERLPSWPSAGVAQLHDKRRSTDDPWGRLISQDG